MWVKDFGVCCFTHNLTHICGPAVNSYLRTEADKETAENGCLTSFRGFLANLSG